MQPLAFLVADSSHVAAARQGVHKLVRDLEFDETQRGRAAVVATEVVTNMIRHAGGGTFTVRPLVSDSALGIEMLAVDSGPGMADFEQSALDGVSTGGSAGTGLGAIRRLSDEFDVNTEHGIWTILRAALWNRLPVAALQVQVGAIVVPKRGETVSGDAWSMCHDDDGVTILVADGLGHGPEAGRASSLAASVLADRPGATPAQLLERSHGLLRHTRGAAVALIRREWAGEVRFVGIGNIVASIIERERRQAMVSHNGIVGHNMNRLHEYRYDWPAGAMLVAHSDGLESRWDLSAHPGIAAHHPSIIAAMLYRHHSRGRDDVVVVVAKAH